MVLLSVATAHLNLAQEAPAHEPTQLPRLSVTMATWTEDDAPVEPAALLNAPVLPPGRSLAESLADLPGVEFTRQGANTVEPTIRGFSFDRISTLFNGLPLLNATPTRTQAPVNFFRSGLLGGIEMQRSLPSVTSGPLTTGGQIQINSLPTAGPAARPGVELSARTFGNQQGFAGGGSVAGATDRVRYRMSGQYVNLNDYEAGDGTLVDADHEGWGESAAIQADVSDILTVDLAMHHYHQDLDRNISLPFDTVDTDFYAAVLNASWQLDQGTLRLRSGHSTTSPYLTSAARPVTTTPGTPTPPPPVTEFTGDAVVSAVGVTWEHRWSPTWSTEFGLDGTWQERDVGRDRVQPNSSVLVDRLWPDVRIRDTGGFGELHWTAEATRARLGARLDRVKREARAADSLIVAIPGARGATVRQNYIAFNGPAAGKTTRDHTTGAINLTLERDVTPSWTTHLGLGLTRMAPTATESYRAFISNPAGIADIGNPDLDPETKHEIEAGMRYRGTDLKFSGQLFYARVDDYIQRERILISPTTVFSFRNGGADFHGAEAALAWVPSSAPGWSLTATGSTVDGTDRKTGIDLAGLPPWSARVTSRYQRPMRDNLFWMEFSGQHTAGKINPNPVEANRFLDTPSSTVWGLRFGVRLRRALTVEVAVENLFDALHYSYLTAPAATGPAGPPGGPPPAPTLQPDNSLASGAAVPGIGRSINLSARWRF